MKYANLLMYSDIRPFEVVRKVSDVTLELREMEADLSEDFTPKFVAGGFAAHCTNQLEQKYTYRSNESAPVIRARLRKDGYFWSKLGKHWLSHSPLRYHDYNF